jgi:hypothetical protein
MSTTLRSLHDWLLQAKPQGADHDPLSCPFCTSGHEGASVSTSDGGAVTGKTYTEEEFNAVLAKVSGLEAKVAELNTAAEASEADAKVAAATADLEVKVTDLQTQLDAVVLEAEAAKNSRQEILSWLDEQKLVAEQAAELDARKEERLAKVREVASFPDDYLEANADRFAAMSDESFAAVIEDWRTIASKGPAGTKGESIPANTAMIASRSDGKQADLLRDVMSMRFQGVDPRRV